MEKTEKLKVLMVKTGELAQPMEIDNTLEAMQNAVGGMIEEYMPFDDEVALVCNEEGKMMGLPWNRAITIHDNADEIADIIAGDFFICYAPIGSEEFLSMPDDLMQKYEEKFKLPEVFYRHRNGIDTIAIPYTPEGKEVLNLDER